MVRVPLHYLEGAKRYLHIGDRESAFSRCLVRRKSKAPLRVFVHSEQQSRESFSRPDLPRQGIEACSSIRDKLRGSADVLDENTIRRRVTWLSSAAF